MVKIKINNKSYLIFVWTARCETNSISVISITNNLNLIDNFLNEKNSFIFESVEKGVIKGRYTIFGRNPDKIWEFNNNNSFIYKKKKKIKINGKPKEIIENIIEQFKFKINRLELHNQINNLLKKELVKNQPDQTNNIINQKHTAELIKYKFENGQDFSMELELLSKILGSNNIEDIASSNAKKLNRKSLLIQ